MKTTGKVLIVSLHELSEALNRTTKMKRAPAGAKSSGLGEGAFVPELTGFRCEMPGGSSLVNIQSGKLEEEVVFDAHRMAKITKVLSSYLNQEKEVAIEISKKEICFNCGTSSLQLQRKV